MIAQFFEVQIKDGQINRYLDLAASLKPALQAMGGCLFIDRFKSLSRNNLLLSYQIWQDEGSMVAWRVDPAHHKVQEAGRERIFDDYRIRIGQVIYEERPGQSVWCPARLGAYNDPKRRPPTFVVAAEFRHQGRSLASSWTGEVFESVYRPGIFALLVDVPSVEDGIACGRRLLADPTTEYFRVIEVARDYGMFNRGEAPQYYPPVQSRCRCARGREMRRIVAALSSTGCSSCFTTTPLPGCTLWPAPCSPCS
ncbi:MAG: antibiotic biosynthesis monooxygenase [Variovorax sp.]